MKKELKYSIINKFAEATGAKVMLPSELLGKKEIRCNCGRLLGYINGEYEIKCPRCKEINKNSI